MDGQVWKDGFDMLIGKLEVWGETTIEMLPNILIASIVMFLFWAASRWVSDLFKKLFMRTHLNENLENLMANIAQLAVIAIGFVIALAILNLQKTVFSLLAGVGVIGLALGFAFQDLAANFISGIMLAVRSPVNIGDLININGIQGRVTEINLRDTVIRNFSGQDIYMPNKEFTANHFTNFSRSGIRRIDLQVGVAYEADAETAVEVITKAVRTVENILQDPAPDIYVKALGDSAVLINVEVFYAYPGGSLNQLTGKCLMAIKKALEAEAIDIPFPVRTLHLEKNMMDSVQSSLELVAHKNQSGKDRSNLPREEIGSNGRI